MPRFFTEHIEESEAYITGDDARHIGRSLRMRLGDEIILCRMGREYVCSIKSISDEQVVCRVLSSHRTLAEPDIKLTLFQAVPKLDKLELIVQKATELGAFSIVPVLTARCISRPDRAGFARKIERLNKIALEAAKQSGRGIVPAVEDIISLEAAAERLSELDLALMCYEKGGVRINEVDFSGAGTVGVLIGSEGGFEDSEAEFCMTQGITAIHLGQRILRCETAPIAALSIIMNLTGNI